MLFENELMSLNRDKLSGLKIRDIARGLTSDEEYFGLGCTTCMTTQFFTFELMSQVQH